MDHCGIKIWEPSCVVYRSQDYRKKSWLAISSFTAHHQIGSLPMTSKLTCSQCLQRAGGVRQNQTVSFYIQERSEPLGTNLSVYLLFLSTILTWAAPTFWSLLHTTRGSVPIPNPPKYLQFALVRPQWRHQARVESWTSGGGHGDERRAKTWIYHRQWRVCPKTCLLYTSRCV